MEYNNFTMKKSKLVQLRESRGLSRYKVAQDTGITYNTLTRLEDPKFIRISRTHIRILKAYYGEELTLEHLLE